MARLYANENFPLPAVLELRRLGHDVLTVCETGKAGQSVPDEAVLAFAASGGASRGDAQSKALHPAPRQQPDHAGVVVCTFDLDFVGQAARIHEALLALPPLAGRLLRINRPA